MTTNSFKMVGMNPSHDICDGEPGPHAASARDAAADLLRALASPTRIAIVLTLRGGGQCVHELVGQLELSQPLVSQHLRVLKDAGVVRGERSGREIKYHLVDGHVAHIVTDALTHANESRDADDTPDEPVGPHHETVPS